MLGSIFAKVIVVNCLAAALLFDACGAAGVSRDPTTGPGTSVSNQKMHRLDVENPSFTQTIGEAQPDPDDKFVEVEIVTVVNPNKRPFSFEVNYKTENGATFLGTFSLYPADLPGKFLVATNGKIRSKGALVLTIKIPEEMKADTEFFVEVREMRLTKGRS